MTKYDDASWHFERDFPENIPSRSAATHIAWFLRWCIERELVSARHASTASVLRSTSAVDYLFDECDGSLLCEDLDTRGNEFARQYYNTLYYLDWDDVYDAPIYSDEKNFQFSRIVARLDQRLLEYESGLLPSPVRRRWWEFWR